jgi:hypothetical protein
MTNIKDIYPHQLHSGDILILSNSAHCLLLNIKSDANCSNLKLLGPWGVFEYQVNNFIPFMKGCELIKNENW